MDKLMTRDEVADLLQVSARTVARLTEQRKLRRTKVGGSVRYTRAAVEEYIRENQDQPPQVRGRKNDIPRFRYVPGMKVV